MIVSRPGLESGALALAVVFFAAGADAGSRAANTIASRAAVLARLLIIRAV
jgi:hypothetical protein